MMPTEWQPAHTAPRNDYEEILALVRTHDGRDLTHRIAMWDPENGDWTVFLASWNPEIIYWMPLPAVPDGESDARYTHHEDAAAEAEESHGLIGIGTEDDGVPF